MRLFLGSTRTLQHSLTSYMLPRTSKLITLVVLSFALLTPTLSDIATAVQPTDVPQFAGSFGRADSARSNGKFSQPGGTTTDNDGNVYVVDSGNSRIQKFTSNGSFITKWGGDGDGDGEFNNPYGVAIDQNGNVYVSDTNNDRIQKFTSGGTFLTKWGSSNGGGMDMDSLGVSTLADDGLFNNPVGIATDLDNNVYVSDAGNNRIQKFSSDGTYISQWGASGTGDGQFDEPQGIATDSTGNVYVTDRYNHRIQKFTGSGTYLSQWGSVGDADGEFSYPGDITTDSSGNVYVTDTNNHRVQKFTNNGTFLTEWGTFGGDDVVNQTGVSGLAGNSEFDSPSGIAADGFGNVYVVDTRNERIQKFTNTGDYLAQWGSEGRDDGAGGGDGELYAPYGLVTDAAGNIYVADTSNNRIQKFSSTGVYLSQWGTEGNGNGEFNEPRALAIDAGGNVYVADTFNNRIQKFSSSGTYLTQWGNSGSGNGEFNQAAGITVDADGNVYVADLQNNRIQKFSSSGTYLAQWGNYGSQNTEFAYPSGVVTDSSRNVYVLDSNNNRIQKFSSNGTYLTQWGEVGGRGYTPRFFRAQSSVSALTGDEGKFYYPRAIALDAADNVYVADSGNGRIQKFTSDGNYLMQWGSPSPGGLVSAGSVFSLSVSASALIGEGFDNPSGITVDAAGNVYIADTDNNRIQKYGYPKTAELVAPENHAPIELAAPAAATITRSRVVTERSLETQDGSKTYPLGLVDFELAVPTGSTQQISLTFVTELRPGDVVARKYHSANKTYGDIPGASITETSYDAKHALRLTYDIADGGPLDDDGVANGVIVDPVGLAEANGPGAPNSGAGTNLHWMAYPTVFVMLTLCIAGYVTRRRV